MKGLLSFLIVFSITALVSVAATVIVSASLGDSHSNIKLAEEVLSKAVPAKADETPMDTQSSKEGEKEALQVPEPAICQTPDTYPSLTTYLRQQGLPRTFEYRSSLAASFGMESYEGTGQQNVALLKELIRSEKQKAGCPLDN
ncbi:MAG: hypothetical protein ABI758_06765 [Candidatus Woesebacteria bacterium]